MHPADLDGALQLTALLSAGGVAGATRLPFGVEEALLAGGGGVLRAAPDEIQEGG